MSGRAGTITTPGWSEFVGADTVTLGGSGLALHDTDGSMAWLPHRSDAQMRVFLKELAGNLDCIRERILTFGTQNALASVTTYRFDYDDLGDDKSVLPYGSTISPRPTNAGQVVVQKNGQLLSGGLDYKVGDVGVILDTVLVANDFCLVTVYSPEIARAMTFYDFDGTYGTGTDHKVFTLNALGPDLFGNTISNYPPVNSKLQVWRNGQFVTSFVPNPDYIVTGAGASTVVTFIVAVATDERITMLIFSV